MGKGERRAGANGRGGTWFTPFGIGAPVPRNLDTALPCWPSFKRHSIMNIMFAN